MIPGEQIDFLKIYQSQLLQSLEPLTQAKWGVMKPQEMTEHLNDFYEISLGKIQISVLTPAEQLPKYLEFLYSEKQFRENTKAPSSLLGDNPLPLRHQSLGAAVENLHLTTKKFFDLFESEPARKTAHPVFGLLNFEEWVRLHYKHVTHHFRQFGLIEHLI